MDALHKGLGGIGAASVTRDITRSMDALHKGLGGMGAASVTRDITRSMDALYKGLGGMSSAARVLSESTRSMDALYKGLGGMGAVSVTRDITRSMDALYKGLGGMSAARVLSESTRSMDVLHKRLGGMGAVSVTRDITRSMDALHKRLGGIGATHVTADTARSINKSLGGMGSFANVLSENTKALSAFYKGLGGIGTARVTADIARPMDALRKSLAEVSAVSGLSQFGATVAAAGLIGNFDQGLTRAAVAATSLIESVADEPAVLDDARAQSALIDSVADVEAFTRKLPTATQDEVKQLTETLLEGLFSKYGERWLAAQSPQARWSLDRILTLIALVLTLWGIRYNELGLRVGDRSLRVSEESLQLAKSAAEGSTQDMAALRAEISKSGKEQVEELQKVREVLERCAEVDKEADTDETTYYIVERSTALTVSPSVKAPKITAIYPNQSVTLIQRKRKWIKVQYYDYLTSKIVEGWVLKKYLRRLPD
ncbi:MAG TPA: SH3 domain-containing protein [Archangium sp.]|uniref:SH3 domain-containing protein n=1 Tax=Archangium sp. TaxID=1872627 RepID=UPI002E32192C|nr:SH3 domain-containing protein [Archangium sp.]HEX5752821.1 SH3 domain-containing protein [Archangium sp.]